MASSHSPCCPQATSLSVPLPPVFSATGNTVPGQSFPSAVPTYRAVTAPAAASRLGPNSEGNKRILLVFPLLSVKRCSSERLCGRGKRHVSLRTLAGPASTWCLHLFPVLNDTAEPERNKRIPSHLLSSFASFTCLSSFNHTRSLSPCPLFACPSFTLL